MSRYSTARCVHHGHWNDRDDGHSDRNDDLARDANPDLIATSVGWIGGAVLPADAGLVQDACAAPRVTPASRTRWSMPRHGTARSRRGGRPLTPDARAPIPVSFTGRSPPPATARPRWQSPASPASPGATPWSRGRRCADPSSLPSGARRRIAPRAAAVPPLRHPTGICMTYHGDYQRHRPCQQNPVTVERAADTASRLPSLGLGRQGGLSAHRAATNHVRPRRS
jgi:hypothetical protein